MTSAVLAFLLNFLLEIMGRHSLFKAAVFVFRHPLPFLTGVLILLLTLCPALFIPKRRASVLLVSTVWFLLGMTNCILLWMRTTPFSFVDITLVTSVLPIIRVYLSIPEIILAALGVLGLVFLLVLLFLRTPKSRIFYRRTGIFALLTALTLTAVTSVSLLAGALSMEFPSLVDAYREYGFAYCFSVSIFDRGIDRPEDYSEDEIDTIVEDVNTDMEEEEAEEGTEVAPAVSGSPNVIFVQLESFFDVNRLENLTFSENPVPFFTELKEKYSGGLLTVPSTGAGTANTEFEILTGMSLDYFGAGEYPYKTVLRETTCESVAYNLSALGYSTCAIHNNDMTFYGRDKVFPNLGFDCFDALEFMPEAETNPLGWAKDSILTGEILARMESTEESDFIFTVSVQAHGRYPDTGMEEAEELEGEESEAQAGHHSGNAETILTTEELEAQTIQVSGIEDEGLRSMYTYYVNQLYEVDAFLRDLVAELEKSEEPVVLVLYGDHLPALSLEEENGEEEESVLLPDGSSIYQTDYIIWDNIGLEKTDMDLSAYQLSAEVLNRLDIHEGVLTRLHQYRDDNPDYQTYLEMLEYDMLYGDRVAWGGDDPYLPTEMELGFRTITVTGMETREGSLYVYGMNFNPFTRVEVDGICQQTEYIDSNRLVVRGYIPDNPTEVRACQYDSSGTRLE